MIRVFQFKRSSDWELAIDFPSRPAGVRPHLATSIDPHQLTLPPTGSMTLEVGHLDVKRGVHSFLVVTACEVGETGHRVQSVHSYPLDGRHVVHLPRVETGLRIGLRPVKSEPHPWMTRQIFRHEHAEMQHEAGPHREGEHLRVRVLDR